MHPNNAIPPPADLQGSRKPRVIAVCASNFSSLLSHPAKQNERRCAEISEQAVGQSTVALKAVGSQIVFNASRCLCSVSSITTRF
jgi:hypothetical protein